MPDPSARLSEIEARAAAATPGPWCTDSWEIYQGTEYEPGISQWIGETCRGTTTPAQDRADAAFVAAARTDVPWLVTQLRQKDADNADLAAKLDLAERQLQRLDGVLVRLRDELAEEKAARNPRLRCLIVKAAPDQDLYIGWSNICEMPAGVWSRETALAYGFPPSRLDRADKNGSSDLSCGDGHWDDKGFIAEQRGWLKRDRLGDYAIEYLHGDRQAAYALLEPFEDTTAVTA